jgi:hypothetical protein
MRRQRSAVKRPIRVDQKQQQATELAARSAEVQEAMRFAANSAQKKGVRHPVGIGAV